MLLNNLTIPEMEMLERFLTSTSTHIPIFRGTILERILEGKHTGMSKIDMAEAIPHVNFALLLIDLSVVYTQLRIKKMENLSTNFLVVIELISFARDMKEYTETLEPEFKRLSNRLWGNCDDFIVELGKISKHENGKTTNGTT